MTRYLIFLLLFIGACQNAETVEKEVVATGEELLSTDVIQNPATAQEPITSKEEKPHVKMPVIEYEDPDIEFGTINEGDTMRHEYKFTNTGDAPLIIASLKPSCGCTAGKYPKEPIQPGESGTVEVVFHSKGKTGRQEKSMAVLTNANPAKVRLYFRGNVIPKDKKK